MKNETQLNILYTNIGRGHPFYLDGIVQILKSKHSNSVRINIIDIFKISKGLSGVLWRLIRHLYKIGSQGGLTGKIYKAIRKNRKPGKYGLIEKILARGIRRYIQKNRVPTVVAHPILVPMISDITDVYYQHGEIAVPDEALVKGAKSIFVPLQYSAGIFKKSDQFDENLKITGLCVESEISQKAGIYFENRLERIRSGKFPIGGFFSSGAEPISHIRKIIIAINSLINENHKCMVFCKKGGILEGMLLKHFKSIKIISGDEIDDEIDSGNIIAISYGSRNEENYAALMAFKYLDYMVAPSHERTNWAAGLGLPMFILHPIIGTFSPLNRQFLLDQGVAIDIETEKKAAAFASLIKSCQSEGVLYSMIQNGFNKFKVTGFEMITDYLFTDITS